MASDAKILIVDDDRDVRTMLKDYLSEHGYEVAEAGSGAEMRAALERSVPRAVLLDLNLPGEDGLTLARYLREHHVLGIIMVTGQGDVVDRIVGLEMGADDYIAKPFDPRELRARLKSVLRRYQTSGGEEGIPAPERARRVPVGSCALDPDSHQLFDGHGEEIPLTAMEFDLLQVFIERPNQVLTRDQLLSLTRNREWEPFDRSIDIRIARLRRKIEADAERPRLIRTVRGAGYMYVPGGKPVPDL
ncbi:MAG TPA: response regulator [Burkholderiales bacterium]|nr:response regulator [Burkholderiales bacterium]